MLRKLFVVAGLFYASSICMAVQPAGTVACLSGKTVDSSGTGIAGTAVTVKQLGGIGAYSAVSDSTGKFQICSLQPGQYQIATHGPEFEDTIRDETLGAGANLSVSIALQRRNALRPAAQPTVKAAQDRDLAASAPDPITEFRVVNDFTPSPDIPNAPLASKRNLPHGQAYGLLGSTLLRWPDVTLPDQLPVSQFGASLGGSFGHDRTSYFVSFDQFGMSQQKLISILAAAQDRTGSAGLPANENISATTAFVARVDHRFSQRDSVYARFNRDDLHSYALRPAQDAALPSLAPDVSVTQQSATVGNVIAISPSTLNETRAQVITSEVQLPAGASALGVQSSLPTTRRNRVFEAADNIYRQAGGQTLRMGGDFIYNQMNISFIESSLGRVSSGNSFFSQSDRSGALYIQSQRKVRPNLLLTSGISYNIQPLRGFKTDTDNLAPQLGVAWAPTSHTVIRGGAGIFYDQIPLPAIAGPSDSAMAANVQNSGRFVSRNGLPAEELGDFITLSPTIQNSYAEEANVQIEQQIGARTVLSAESQYVRGVQLALPVLRTAGLCASNSPCNAGNSFQGQEIGSGAVSTYTGFSVAFAQQPVRWGNYKVSYTYSTADGSGMQENTSTINDQMRRLSLTGVLHTSQDPASDLWQRLAHGFVFSGTGDYTDKSEFVGLNFINFNARLSKTLIWGQHYHFDALAETFNMLQRSNAAFAKSAAEMGSSAAIIFSTYERIASAQSPNASQLGLRLTF